MNRLILVIALMFQPIHYTLFAQTDQQKPNIILVMVDDLGYGDLGSYGQKLIKTPNLDTLAQNGLRFTNYYSGSTVCSPSRETLLTGMHTGHTFIRGNFLTDQNEDIALPYDKVTIAELLRKNGYRTGLIGKWGLGGEEKGPSKQGFDYSFGYLDQIRAHNYYPPYLYENGEKIILEKNADGQQEEYSHNLLVEKTMDFLNKGDQENPFFLYLPYTIPHGKHVIPNNEPYSAEPWDDEFKNYAAMISLLDKDIGRILNKLKENNMDKNTIVFFTSDNGANLEFAKFFKSNGSFKGGKTTLDEGGIRVPLIAYWPEKIKKGEVSDHISAAWDFLPTLCEIAKVTTPKSIDGISFYPTLMGNTEQEEHPYLYWEYYNYNWKWQELDNKDPRNWLDSRALRMGKWKAIMKNSISKPNGSIKLYNLEKDGGENLNVASQHPKLIKKIEQIFDTSSNKVAYFPYQLQTTNTNTTEDIKEFFTFSPNKTPLVSAHRGGPSLGFPENCIATFENTILHTPSLLEIDPRYTKDGEIVLMHDPTLDRTTNGHGKVSDHTLIELSKLRLKDREGNLTNFQIPTLDEALQWAKGKTILVVDAKNIPIEVRIDKIVENNAEANAIVIAYSIEDIKKAYKINKDIIMEIMMGKEESIKIFEDSGVPWKNVIGFIGHDLPPNKEIIKALHDRGVMCIQGSSRNYDKQFISGEINRKKLKLGYLNIIDHGVDIIEADLPVEVGSALNTARVNSK